MRSRLLVLLAAAAVSLGRPAAAQSSRFVVVVNAANPTQTLPTKEVSRIFRKDVTRWSDGSAIQPVELPSDAPARAEFTQRVHGKPVQAMVAFWQQQIFSGRAVPPLERKNDAEVVEYVRSHPGAIGYVTAGTSLPADVKTVAVQ
ncbi:MAG TPA: substrate-binding domain-containing protein [Gemmatimonadaceae bacterium]